ncbi:MAG: hypothetical protein H6838_00470 [Planctomycetes bacterium]|nr:hypothetical protein [Planctomycetota bacterium]
MIPATVQLRHAATGLHPGATITWFVPGNDPQEWLRELITFGVDLGAVTLLAVPRSALDRRPLGVIALLPAGSPPHAVGRARPWTRRADFVLHPADAELTPPCSDAELERLRTYRWLVMHPVAGPVGFTAEDQLTVADLVSVDLTADPWDRATPGTAAAARLCSVGSAEPRESETFFAPDAATIGKANPQELPPLPSERRPKTPGASAAINGLVAKAILWSTRNVRRTANAPTWIDRLEAWATRQLSHRKKIDDDKRRRELERLLALLRDDPARGLHFAIPLSGLGDRGRAPAADRLPERKVDFSLRQLDGGRAVDAWHVEQEQQRQLAQHYRTIANAEIAAGRHRRAAYIFAHLLGDLRGAAQVLRQGGFHREAAELFGERLRDWAAASDCLVRAGLLAEAAELEQRLDHHERAGDLWLILGQQEGAILAYTKAHEELVDRGDWLAAAMLQAEKLRDPEGSLRRLHSNREDSPQTTAAWLSLLHRCRGMDAVVKALRAEPPSCLLAGVLGAFVRHYPTYRTAPILRDYVRRTAAMALQDAPPRMRIAMLVAMHRVSPDDPLLAHDLRCAKEQLDVRPAPIAPPRRPAARGHVERVRTQLLPREGPWHWFGANHLGLAMMNDRFLAVQSWNESSPPLVEPHPGLRAPQFCSARGAAHIFLATGLGSERPALWQTHTFSGLVRPMVRELHRGTVAATIDDDGSLWTLTLNESEVVLRRESTAGDLFATYRLEPATTNTDDGPHLVATGGVAVASFGDQVWLVTETSSRRCVMPSRVVGLSRSAEAGRQIVLVALEYGFVTIDPRLDELPEATVHGRDLQAPTLGWTGNDVIVAVDGRQIATWSIDASGTLTALAAESWTFGKPRAIHASDEPDRLYFVSAPTMTQVRVR